jgi:hypothetical protein
MRVPFCLGFYLADIVAEIAASVAVAGAFLIGWHGEPLSLAKLAKHLAILAALVNRLLLLKTMSKNTQYYEWVRKLVIPA